MLSQIISLESRYCKKHETLRKQNQNSNSNIPIGGVADQYCFPGYPYMPKYPARLLSQL